MANNITSELLAYDMIAKMNYFMGNTGKTKFYHERSIRGYQEV